MKHKHLVPGNRRREAGLALLIILIWLVGGINPQPASAQGPGTPRAYLPVLIRSFLAPEGRICRLGVTGAVDSGKYPVAPLRIGWYMNWGTIVQPARPGGIAYAQTISFQQTGPDSYGLRYPTPATVPLAVKANKGAMWILGNEPDRRYYQDGVEPQIYAKAYHDYYYLIKGLDSTAQIVAGNIVEPTPLRLRYLDKVLANYKQRYGESMPVDIWGIHSYPLNEQSCEARCGNPNCTGAEIPPGFSECKGTVYSVADSWNTDIFKRYMVQFRQWMAANGYRNSALIVPEWGVLMSPSVIDANGVNAYMNTTTQYMLGADSIDATIGDPFDNNHLVQRLAWFSLDVMSLDGKYLMNGWLFDPNTLVRTPIGDNFAAQAATIAPTLNLMAANPTAVPVANQRGTVNLSVQVVNNGNISVSHPVAVRFYNGKPDQGGVQIGQDQMVDALDGCATRVANVNLTWQGAASGNHTVVAVVDPTNQVNESKADNSVVVSVTVP